ncbi:MAG: hypothetical protein ABEI74_02875 [Candidatus Pacearchaeota archaeon]
MPKKEDDVLANEEEYKGVFGIKRLFAVIILVSLAVIGFQLLSEMVSFEIGVIASMITFVYGFFMNSLLSFVQNKYVYFKTNMSNISANLQSIYELSLLTKQKKFIKEVKNSIIKFLDKIENTDPQYYEKHIKEINKLYGSLDQLKVRGAKETSLCDSISYVLTNISINREKMEAFGDRYLQGENKFLIYLLTSLVIASLLIVSATNYLFGVLGGVMVLGIIYATRLIFDMDNLKYGRTKILFKNIEELRNQIERSDKKSSSRK